MKNHLINYKSYLRRWSVWATSALAIVALVAPVVIELYPRSVAVWAGITLILGIIKQGDDGPLGRLGKALKELFGASILLSVLLVALLMQSGCGLTKAEHACAGSAELNYWEQVEECKEAGKTFDECTELSSRMKDLEREHEKCIQ